MNRKRMRKGKTYEHINKNIDLEMQNTLQYAFANGILDLDRVHELCMASKREQVKALHPYSITSPSKEGERWRTNFTDKNGKRKTIRAQSEEELLDKLVPLYLDSEYLEKKTFRELFEEWILYKTQMTSSPNTILRHRQHFKKYMASSKLYEEKILKITELLLETECNRIVKEHNLSSKEWVNLKTILNGMFEYAYRMKYLSENPMPKIRIGVKFRQMVKKTGKTQTYNTEEQEELITYLDKMFRETGDASFMAVKINFFMGLRVGELVALKWEDLYEGNQIHVVREEVRDQTANKVTIADHTKTNTDRYVYLIPDALEILAKLPRDSEFIFTREGKRLTARQINYVLEKYAQRNDLQVKSSHKLRKTYASMCNAKGIPIDFIREQLGHASLATTYGYLYNPLTEAESYRMLTEALSRDESKRSDLTKKAATPDREPDIAASVSENAAENVVSIADFRNRKSTVPKMTSNVPKITNA